MGCQQNKQALLHFPNLLFAVVGPPFQSIGMVASPGKSADAAPDTPRVGFALGRESSTKP